MEVEVKRHEIDLAKYGWYVKDYVLKFLKDNHVLNSKNANNLQNIKIYAENLRDQQQGGAMCARYGKGKNPPEIVIDFQFFNLETMTLKKQNQKLIFSQIIHEILHQVSSYKDKEGKSVTGVIREGSKRDKYTVMNEGFTQMITERITGFTVSPDTDRHYTYFKNIAKIIADTVGDEAVYESYFMHNHSIDNLLDNVAKDDGFFESLMSQMSIFNCRTINNNIKSDVKELIIKKMCSSVIIPNLRTLPRDKQREYLMKIQNDLKNDETFLRQWKSCMNKYNKLDNKQLLDKKAEIEKSLSNYNMMINASTLNFSCADIGRYYKEYLLQQMLPIVSFNNNTCKINIDKEMNFEFGNNIYAFSREQVKCIIESSEQLKNELYSEYYIKKFAVNRSKKGPEDIRNVLNEKAEKNAEEGVSGKIIFLPQESKLERYLKFIAVKSALEKNGIIILDDVEDAISKEEVNPNFIKLPDKNEIYKFENLKKVYENVKVVEYNDADLGVVKKVINNITGKEIHNEKLIEVAKFADTWCNSFLYKDMAFNKKSEELYKEFINAVSRQAIRTEETNYEEIYNELKDSQATYYPSKYNDILKALLYKADKLSNIRRFIDQMYPDASKELEKPNTFEQFGNSLDSEGFSREEIAKKISPKTIGNETANVVQYSNIRVAENLLKLRNNEREMQQNNSNR